MAALAAKNVEGDSSSSKKRRMIAEELLETEKTYVENLKTLDWFRAVLSEDVGQLRRGTVAVVEEPPMNSTDALKNICKHFNDFKFFRGGVAAARERV